MALVVKKLPANAGDKRCRFDPRVRKIPWRNAWQPTPVFLPGESPWTEEPGRLWFIGLHRVGHDWSNLAHTQPVHPKGDQSWVFIGRSDAEAETPTLWPPDAKSWLIWKDPDAGKDWGQEEKETTEDELVGGHHRLNGHGFGWTLAVGDGHRGLGYCGSWGCK